MLIEVFKEPLSLLTGTFVSEDLAYFYGLFGVQSHYYSELAFIIYYSVGIILGDCGLYFIGLGSRKVPFLKKRFPIKKTPAPKKFDSFLLLTRFLPGTRLPTYLYCGFKGYHFGKFVALLSFSTVCYAITGLMFLKIFGLLMTEEPPLSLRIALSVLTAFSTIALFKLMMRLYDLKIKFGEIWHPLMILIKRYRRLEFWNSWFLYVPFVPKFISLLFKYRGFNVCLSANPSIHMAGLIGERKSDIEHLLAEHLPEQSLRSYQYEAGQQLNYPVVIKPDSGLRGTDVSFLTCEEDLEHYLQTVSKELVYQEYCDDGNEWGAFYVRYPHEKQGRIFSITEKKFPTIKGDGRRNCFDLVLDDALLRERFDWIFASSTFDPHHVPAAGETVVLSRKGSHSKGCPFLDGSQYLEYSDSLARALDKLPGFYVGRIDVKFKNLEELAAGKFNILEVNGAAAESTNIYDPSFGPGQIYRILAQQWEHIFAIGHELRQAGFKDHSLSDFFKEVILYKRSYAKRA